MGCLVAPHPSPGGRLLALVATVGSGFEGGCLTLSSEFVFAWDRGRGRVFCTYRRDVGFYPCPMAVNLCLGCVGGTTSSPAPGPTVLGSRFQKGLSSRREGGWGPMCLCFGVGVGRWGEDVRTSCVWSNQGCECPSSPHLALKNSLNTYPFSV